MKRLLFILVLFSAIGAAAQTNPNPIAYKFRTIQEAVSGFADTNSIVQVSDTLSGGNFVVKRRASGYRPNGGTILAMADSVSVLVRDISQAQAMNILWFDARPDYDTLTKSGTDISVALMLAANVGKNVFIPEGNYIIRHPALFRNMKNIRVFGTPQTNIYLPDDYASNALTPNTLRKAVLDFYHIKNVEVDHINFFLNRTGMGITTNSNYIYAVNMDYGDHRFTAGMGNLAYVHNINVNNAPDACIASRTYETIRIEDNDLEDITTGVAASFAKYGKFIHNTIVGGMGMSDDIHVGGQGLSLGDITHLTVLNNVLDSITDSGIACYSAEFADIEGNYLENMGKDGLKVLFGGNTDTGFAKKCIIRGNTVKYIWPSRHDGGAMIKVWPLQSDAIITENILIGGRKKRGDLGGESGITVVGWGNSDHNLVAKRALIGNNTFRNLQQNCLYLTSAKGVDIFHNMAYWDSTTVDTPTFLSASNVSNIHVSYNEMRNATDSLNGAAIGISGFPMGDVNEDANDYFKVDHNTMYGFNTGVTLGLIDSSSFVEINNNDIDKVAKEPILAFYNLSTAGEVSHFNIEYNKIKNSGFSSATGNGLIRLLHLERGGINNLSIKNNTALRGAGRDLPLVSLETTGSSPYQIDLAEFNSNTSNGFTAAPLSVTAIMPIKRAIGLPMSAPPATGTYLRGDVITNSNPSLQAPNGWICTAGGSPGKWQVTGYGGEFYVGAGDPEGVTYANRGALYMRNGATGSTDLLFSKTTDSTFNTGWSHVIMDATGIVPIAKGGTANNSFNKNALNFFNGTAIASSHFFDSAGNMGIRTPTPVSAFANTTTNPVFSGVGVSSGAFTWDGTGAGYAGAIVNTGTGSSRNGLLVNIADNSASSYAAVVSSGTTPLLSVRADGLVGIGIQGGNGSALVDMTSTTRGLLIPRMTTTQRDAIAAPAAGLLVQDNTVRRLAQYNSVTSKFNYYLREGLNGGNKDSFATAVSPQILYMMAIDSTTNTLVKILPSLVTPLYWSRTGTTLSTATAGDNVNIGGTLNVGTSANVSSAIGQFASTTKGFLLPKMTTTQRDAIAGPVSGLFVYNTTTNTLDYYDGTAWVDANGGATVHYWKLANNTLSPVTPGNNVTVDGKLKIGVTPQGSISQSLVTYGSDSALNIISPGVFLAAQHPASTGSVPTISSNGTNVTATITGHDAAFQLTLTVSAGGASGTMCNITFNTVWNLVPKVIFSAATQAAGGTALAANATSTGGMTVTYNGTLPAGTYVYNFMCLQ